MNEPSPYQPPLPQGAPSMPYFITEAPPVVKVMGILHLVFAGFGILGAVWGLFIAIVGNPFLKLMPSSPQLTAQLEAQMAMQEKIKPMTLTSSTLSLLVAIPMIIAGIKMLRNHKDGLKWSNIYAGSSLTAKAVNMILAVTILIPAMREMTDGITGGSHMPGAAKTMMGGFMAGGAIGGALIACAYPLLTLILLNRAAPKAWFASLAK
ncbi:MAG: hypothetical protein ABIT37_00355 [Luteolibacter sp.]